jgi:hypothetical protein
MTKTEAAEIIALDVRVQARKAGRKIDKAMCEERVSELRGQNYQGNLKGDAANIASPRTVLRIALRDEL